MTKLFALFRLPVLLRHSCPSFRIRRILPVFGCLLLAGLAPSLVFGACSVPIETSEVAIPKWHSNSGWLPLTNDPALRSSITELTVTVTNNDSTIGNTIHVLENWNPVAIVTADVDSTTTFSIPASSTPATLQFYIAHAIGASYSAELSFCVEPPGCESGIYSALAVPQDCLPVDMSVTSSPTFGKWREKIDPNGGNSTFIGASNTGEDCRDLHDRYWVKGDDGMAYHTWHPAAVDGCVFRHEHGDNAATSDIFNYAGGYPPFAFVMEQQHSSMPNMKRHEDHFGHKIFVANNIKLAIGTSTDTGIDCNHPSADCTVTPIKCTDTLGECMRPIYDAGITCDWLSKIHQGSHSADALTNNTHEYFLNMRCNDTHQQEPTEFSVKVLADWGQANKVTFIGGPNPNIDSVTTDVTSFLTKPWNGEPDPITPPTRVSPPNPAGAREFVAISGLQWKNWNDYIQPVNVIKQPELWQQDETSIKTPVGSITFAPYYVVKNPARLLRQDNTLQRTVDLCYDNNGTQLPGGFCSILPPSHPGQDYWKSVESPFNGSVRALNFKAVEVNNDGGPAEFCTDPFGQNASYLPCIGNKIKQKSASIRNYWNSQNRTNFAQCIRDTSGVCHMPDEPWKSENLAGTLERWTMDNQNGTWSAKRESAIPLGGSAYKPAGIGFEWISNHGNDAGVRTPN